MSKGFIKIVFLSLLFFAVIIAVFNLRGGEKREVNTASCVPSNLTGEIDLEDTYAYFEGKSLDISQIALADDEFKVLGASHEERWIEVDLSEQKLRAWEGDQQFLETAVSTGLPWYPTPTGEFRIWIKLRATKMEGGTGKYYYYLPNVPYVMYFESENLPGWRGYGLHGTYWHNDFGTPRSHGCVNLPTSIAKEIYYWVDPVMPDGKNTIRATGENLGTRIVIHE